MDSINALVAFLVALSLATERVTEVLKGLPLLSRWFAVEKPAGSLEEASRKASVQVLAIVVGTCFAYEVPGPITSLLKGATPELGTYLLFGALASGGSGFWNSLLDLTREAKRQREALAKTAGGGV